MRVKKVAVGRPAMSNWRGNGCAAQHFLVDHEFTIVFSYRTWCFAESGLRQIGAFCPFPALAPLEITGCSFPFKFGWQSHTLPTGIGVSFIIANVA